MSIHKSHHLARVFNVTDKETIRFVVEDLIPRLKDDVELNSFLCDSGIQTLDHFSVAKDRLALRIAKSRLRLVSHELLESLGFLP